MGAPGSLDRDAVDLARAGPALRRPQDEHRPARPLELPAFAGRLLDLRDRVEGAVERSREPLVDQDRLLAVEAALDDDRVPAVPLEQRHELAPRDPVEHGRVRDLPAVQVQDREDDTVAARVEELVRVPARSERPRLRLAVADDAGDQQLRVVERGAEGVHERVAELAALVDRARRLGRGVAGDAAREGELAEQLAQSLLAVADVRVELAVRPLEVGVGDVRRPAVARPGDEDRIEVARPDRPVQVRVDEVEARHRAEVAEQPGLHVLRLQRLAQERVVEQVDLADRQVVRRPPVRVEEPKLLDADRGSRSSAGANGSSSPSGCRPSAVRPGRGRRARTRGRRTGRGLPRRP